MKKIITSILLVLSLVLLVACVPENGGGETDTTDPVIIGADNVTITQGEAFDPLAGVTATDNVDGNIVLTSANVSGTVNVNVPGTYPLTYTVTDQAGNTATKQRTVTVIAPGPLGNLIGGDFSGSGLGEGWATWRDGNDVSGYNATFNVVGGALEIDIITAPPLDIQWWGVQVQYNAINLDAFASYTLKFDVKADDARYMNHQIQNWSGSTVTIPAPGKAYGEANFTPITTEWQTITQDFYVTGPAENAQLQFSFGNFAESTGVPAEFRVVETKVYLDNVIIVEGPELENSAPQITAQNLVVAVGQTTPLKQGISVLDDFSVISIVDVIVTQTSPATPEFNPLNPEKGVYTFSVYAEDGEGLSTTVTRTITVADPWNRPLDMVPTGGASEAWWAFEADEGNWIDVTHEDGVTAVEILEVPDSDWKSMFRIDAVQFFAGTYDITFEVRSDDERDIRVAIENAGLENAFSHFTATEDWTLVTLTYEFATSQFNRTFAFWFGSLTTGRPGAEEGTYEAADDILTTVYFKNFSVAFDGELIEPVWNVPTNMIVAEGGWSVFESDGDWIDVTNTDGMAIVEILAIGGDDWRAAFRVQGVDFKPGTYTVKFDVMADDERDVRVAIEGTGLANTYSHFTAPEDWTAVELTYVFEVDQNGKTFAFWFGTLTTDRAGVEPGTYEAADNILTTVYFKNFRVEFEPGESAGPWNRPTDMIPTEGTADGWWASESDGNWIDVTHDDGVTAVEILGIAPDDWRAMFRVDTVQFFAGTYVITFDVRAEDERDVRVAVEQTGLANPYRHFTATDEWTTITITLEFATDQLNKTFAFWFGTLTTDRTGVEPGTYEAADDVETTVYFRNFAVDYTEPAE